MFQRRWTSEKIISHILAREGVEPLNSHYYATTYPDVYAKIVSDMELQIEEVAKEAEAE